MSEPDTTTALCPRCGHRLQVVMHSGINRAQDPEVAQLLLEGTLFQATCPSCGAQIQLDYPLLWHDLQHRCMVQYVTDDDEAAHAHEVFDQARRSAEDAGVLGIAFHGYSLRVVRTQNDLREKALVFDADVDDRLLEVCKAVALYQLIGPEAARAVPAYFDELAPSGELAVTALPATGEPQNLLIPLELQSQVRADLDANPNEDGYVIDRAWALEALGI